MDRGGWHDLVDVIRRLQAPDGCPWDRSQTAATLRPYLLEECCETLASIDANEGVDEELGDLLFVLLSIAELRMRTGGKGADAVAAGAAAKMRERHPDLFEGTGPTSDGSMASWEARKARQDRSALDGVPKTLPGLLRAHRVGEKVAARGFDWPDPGAVRAKLDEELAEMDAALAAGNSLEIEEELGDVLFTLAQVARHAGVSGEDALRGALAKFEGRFRIAEADIRRDAYEGREPDVLDTYWRRAKATWRA